jgi:phage/plasmid-associated DNA primase
LIVENRVNRLKQLRGNDLIQARGLYKDSEEYRPQFGMVFQMNEIPELSKVDDAISKSLKIVEFPYQFVDSPLYEYQRKLDAS